MNDEEAKTDSSAELLQPLDQIALEEGISPEVVSPSRRDHPPHYRFGQMVLARRSEVRAWLRSHYRPGRAAQQQDREAAHG